MSVLFVSVLAVAGAPATPAGAEVVDLSHAVATAEPAGTGVTGTIYAVGGLELDVGDGRVYALRSGERVLGAFVTGAASYRFTNREPLAARNFEANVRRSTGNRVANGALSGEIEGAWILDGAILERIPQLGAAEGAAPDTVMEDLEKLRERFSRDVAPSLPQLIAQAMLEGRAADASAVLIAGRDDLRHVRDLVRSGEESLSALKRYPQGSSRSGRRYLQPLVANPAQGDALSVPARRWRLTHVDLVLVNREGQSLELEVRETITAEAPVRTLGFELWEAVYDGAEWIPYRVESVALADGRKVAWVREGTDLLVELPETLAAGDSVELAWRLSGDILVRPGKHSFWWLPISSWLPLPDRLDMKHFTYRAEIKVGGGFEGFSMGRTVRRWEEPGLACAEFRLDKPVQFAVVLAGAYNSYVEERDGLTIRLASYAFKRNDSMKRIANNAFELIALYEKLLGDFPFTELSILEINSYGFGIAPPGVIYLTSEAFDPGPEGRRYRAELNSRMAHEVAHQWWGHVAQMAGWREQWLSESTAEYYAGVAIGILIGEHKFKASMRSWKEQAGWADDFDSVYYANLVTGESAFRERFGLLYARGPLVLHELRGELGDQAFFTIFKSLLSNFPFEVVDTGTFIELTNYITKKDYGPWIHKRLVGAEE